MKKYWKIIIAILVAILLISIILLVSNRYDFGADTNGDKIPLEVDQSEEYTITD